jgi:DNA helicase-2/ATP-dependent DNA helicase PcrA
MTLQSAKGLEFPLVFLAGLEEGLFPLSRAIESEGGLEEERRLFYVGVTRAEDRLCLLFADRRWRAGMESHSAPSSFLDELPEQYIEHSMGGGVRSRPRRKTSYSSSNGGGARWKAPDFSGSTAAPAAPGGSAYGWHRESRKATDMPEADGELRYDYTDSQEPLELTAGTRIIHPRFGPGEIVTITGLGRDAKAEIEFEEVGLKKVLVAYAGLLPG